MLSSYVNWRLQEQGIECTQNTVWINQTASIHAWCAHSNMASPTSVAISRECVPNLSATCVCGGMGRSSCFATSARIQTNLPANKPVNEGFSGPGVGVKLEVVSSRLHVATLTEKQLDALQGFDVHRRHGDSATGVAAVEWSARYNLGTGG
jgi:hypothetical protein